MKSPDSHHEFVNDTDAKSGPLTQKSQRTAFIVRKTYYITGV